MRDTTGAYIRSRRACRHTWHTANYNCVVAAYVDNIYSRRLINFNGGYRGKGERAKYEHIASMRSVCVCVSVGAAPCIYISKHTLSFCIFVLSVLSLFFASRRATGIMKWRRMRAGMLEYVFPRHISWPCIESTFDSVAIDNIFHFLVDCESRLPHAWWLPSAHLMAADNWWMHVRTLNVIDLTALPKIDSFMLMHRADMRVYSYFR